MAVFERRHLRSRLFYKVTFGTCSLFALVSCPSECFSFKAVVKVELVLLWGVKAVKFFEPVAGSPSRAVATLHRALVQVGCLHCSAQEAGMYMCVAWWCPS